MSHAAASRIKACGVFQRPALPIGARERRRKRRKKDTEKYQIKAMACCPHDARTGDNWVQQNYTITVFLTPTWVLKHCKDLCPQHRRSFFKHLFSVMRLLEMFSHKQITCVTYLVRCLMEHRPLSDGWIGNTSAMPKLNEWQGWMTKLLQHNGYAIRLVHSLSYEFIINYINYKDEDESATKHRLAYVFSF